MLTALVWLPNLVSPFLGAWIDRQQHKKRLLVVADLLRAALLLTVPLAFAFDALTLRPAVRRRAADRRRVGAVQHDVPGVLRAAGAATRLPRREQPAQRQPLGVVHRRPRPRRRARLRRSPPPSRCVVDALSFVWSAVFVGRSGPAAPPVPRRGRGRADDLAAARRPRGARLHAAPPGAARQARLRHARSTSSRSCSRRAGAVREPRARALVGTDRARARHRRRRRPGRRRHGRPAVAPDRGGRHRRGRRHPVPCRDRADRGGRRPGLAARRAARAVRVLRRASA